MPGRDAISKLALSRKHVAGGQRIVAAQEMLVARIRADGGDPADAQSVLDSFRRTQRTFEDELAGLLRRPPGKSS